MSRRLLVTCLLAAALALAATASAPGTGSRPAIPARRTPVGHWLAARLQPAAQVQVQVLRLSHRLRDTSRSNRPRRQGTVAVATPAPLELDGPDCRPLLVAVGASYSDGIGAGHRSDAWPYQLAQLLHWRVVAEGAPGAGYIRRGWHGAGPMDRLVAKLDLRQLHPSLVIIQSGHNDIGEPLALLRQRVIQVIDLVRHDAPTSLVGVLTVFTRPREPTPAARATNQTIIAAARHADPAVLVFDPLANHWHYQRADAGHGLHPTDAGYHWIAERMDLMIHRDGVLSSDSTLVRGSGCSAAEATDSSERPGHGAGLRRWVMTPAATRAAVARRLPVRRVGKPGAQ